MLPFIWQFPWSMLYNPFPIITYEADKPKEKIQPPEVVKRRQRVWSKLNSESLYKLCKEKSCDIHKPLEELSLADMMQISQELDRTPQQCLSKLRLILSCGSLKAGIWTGAEDDRLITLMNEGKRWFQIARSLNLELHRSIKVRNGKQCKERWKNHLNPEINHGPWSTSQDIQLLQSVQNHGLQWRDLKHEFPERTENSIKNRLKSLLNKKWQETDSFEDKESLEHTVGNLIASLTEVTYKVT